MIKFKQIEPAKLKVKDFESGFAELIKDTIDAADDEFAKTYASFSHKPAFRKTIKKTEGSTLTSGEGSTDNPYPFVTKGTSVRYATMTPDFAPKTKKRVIGSGGGRGGVLYVDKRRPRKGIEAREFEETIAELMLPKFQKDGQKILDKSAKKSGHAI